MVIFALRRRAASNHRLAKTDYRIAAAVGGRSQDWGPHCKCACASQRLPSERELCEDFGASRSSLREALRCLSIVGVLNARVGEGTSVAVDDEKFLRKIIEWRMITERHDVEDLLKVGTALEGVSAADTALRETDEDIEKLRKLLAKMKTSLKNENAFAALDLEFHVTLASISGNSMLSDLISLIRSQVARTLHMVLHLPNAIPLSHKEHTLVFEAIERHDSEGARKAMQDHLDAHLQRYTDATGEPVGTRGNATRVSNKGNLLAHSSKR